MKHYKTYL